VGEERLQWDCIIRGPNNEPICAGLMAGYSKATARANFKLIAAAPELLEALRAVMSEAKDANENGDVLILSHVVDLVQQAIAKATGAA
jgi:hypothetical protein